MGQDDLLFSIAVVVPGGTAIPGGQASATGVWGASLPVFLDTHGAWVARRAGRSQ
jgi:ribose/xylose/arabinose/galactoside ABC-type transport system permease subunit